MIQLPLVSPFLTHPPPLPVKGARVMPAESGGPAPSRRRIPFTAAAAASMTVSPAAVAPTSATPAGHGDVTGPQPASTPFALSEVRLIGSPFLADLRRTCACPLLVDLDRPLPTFRLNAGRRSSAEPCGGWEAPGVRPRGHATGHLLGALARARADTGDPAHADKARSLVSAPAECRRAASAAGFRRGCPDVTERLRTGAGTIGVALGNGMSNVVSTADSVGYAELLTDPAVEGDMTSASGSCRTPYGIARSDWERTDGRSRLTGDVPVGSTAEVCVPAADGRAEAPEGARLLRTSGEEAVHQAGSGHRTFRSAPPRS